MFFAKSCRPCAILALAVSPMLTGCAAWRSVPATCYPSAVFYSPRSSQEPINFVHLRQDPPDVYLLGPGDILGIYVARVLGEIDVYVDRVTGTAVEIPKPPPVHIAEDSDLPPAVGYPVPVREDGTISLPMVPPLSVGGLTLAQVEEMIRKAYVPQLLQPDEARIIVTLMRSRTYQVLVIREDTTMPQFRRGDSAGELILGSGKRGMTYTVELPAYENDVLHALSESGGLPGVDAKNEITILRGGFGNGNGPNAYLTSLLEDPEGSPFVPAALGEVLENDPNVVKIPLRSRPGEPPPELSQDDIILNKGDVVFIESREAEVFYTGGLMRGGQFPIPRDYDLDVLGAMAMAGGSVAGAPGGAGSVSSGIGGTSGGGIGAIFPPTQVLVLRTVNGQQTSIRVNLKRALIDPRERILIEPNDFVLLQYTPCELVLNIMLNNLQFNYFLNSFR